MKVSSTRYCISVKVQPGDEMLLVDKEPTPLQWLGGEIGKLENEYWLCCAGDVVIRSEQQTIAPARLTYVPAWRGVVPPRGKALDESLRELTNAIAGGLQALGFCVETRGAGE